MILLEADVIFRPLLIILLSFSQTLFLLAGAAPSAKAMDYNRDTVLVMAHENIEDKLTDPKSVMYKNERVYKVNGKNFRLLFR